MEFLISAAPWLLLALCSAGMALWSFHNQHATHEEGYRAGMDDEAHAIWAFLEERRQLHEKFGHVDDAEVLGWAQEDIQTEAHDKYRANSLYSHEMTEAEFIEETEEVK